MCLLTEHVYPRSLRPQTPRNDAFRCRISKRRCSAHTQPTTSNPRMCLPFLSLYMLTVLIARRGSWMSTSHTPLDPSMPLPKKHGPARKSAHFASITRFQKKKNAECACLYNTSKPYFSLVPAVVSPPFRYTFNHTAVISQSY